MQLQKNKGKIVFLVKRELPFPDIGIFKKLNRIYWWIIFNFLVLGTIKRHKKEENFLVVTSLELYTQIKKNYENTRLFEGYIKVRKKYSDPYIRTIKIAKNLFKKLGNLVPFEDYNLGDYMAEEFAYGLTSAVEELETIKEIKQKEDAREFIVLDREPQYVKIASLFAIVSLACPVSLSDAFLKAKRYMRRYSLEIRMLFPSFFNNQEFAKKGMPIDCKNKKILFAAYDKSDLMRIFPLIEITRKKNREFVVLTNYKDARNILHEKNIPYIFFGDFLDKEDRRVIHDKKRVLMRKWSEIKKRDDNELLCGGHNLWEAVEPELEYQFFTRLPWLMYYIAASRKLLKNNIGAIITEGDLSPRSRSLVEVGKRQGIPSLLLQEGATLINDTPRGFVPLISDKIAVWGNSTKEYLEDYNIDPKRIVITGCAEFDKYIKKRTIDREIYKKLGINRGDKFFILATLTPDYYFVNREKIELIKTVLEIMNDFPDKKLVIKLHPRDKESTSYAILSYLKKEKQEKIVIIRDIDIGSLLKASELLIAVNSTVTVEAMLLNTPVINLDVFNCRPELKGFGKFNASRIVNNRHNISHAIGEVLSNGYKSKYNRNRKKFLKWYLYKMDGKSSERILNLIEEMMGKK